MFHHFHNDKHLSSQGSIDSKTFEDMISYLQENYSLLNAEKYIEKTINNSLVENEICLTFDDSLRCQYDIALPILNKRKISAFFFFIYTSIITNSPDYLELYRYFRTICFEDIDIFYQRFFEIAESRCLGLYKKRLDEFDAEKFISDCPFYSFNDKWFRYLRDFVLIDGLYDEIMKKMMSDYEFDIKSAAKMLWMNQEHIKDIFDNGHQIGLHSHNHPTKLNELETSFQYHEYSKNLEYLERIVGKGNIISMSHPCGSYNKDTLEILRELGIKIGFRASMLIKDIKSPLEIPREDHANILNLIN